MTQNLRNFLDMARSTDETNQRLAEINSMGFEEATEAAQAWAAESGLELNTEDFFVDEGEMADISLEFVIGGQYGPPVAKFGQFFGRNR